MRCHLLALVPGHAVAEDGGRWLSLAIRTPACELLLPGLAAVAAGLRGHFDTWFWLRYHTPEHGPHIRARFRGHPAALRRDPIGDAVRAVLGYLVDLAKPINVEGQALPGWWTCTGPIGRPDSSEFPGGHGNAGMAHGIGGPLALLALAARRGVAVPGQREAIEAICGWLDFWRTDSGTGSIWPYLIRRVERDTGHRGNSREGDQCGGRSQGGRPAVVRCGPASLLASGALGALFPADVLTLDDADRLASVMAQPSRVDPQVISYFDRLLTEHYTADQILGPHQILGPVLAQLDMLDTLRKHARPPVAKPLLRVLAQYAEFVGWLQQDAGAMPAAMYWSDRATQWAQSAGDYQMAAYLLVRKSNIAYLVDDANTVIELAAAAQDAPGDIDPKITALATQQEARGWAMINDGDRCRRKLDTAGELLSRYLDGGAPTAPVYMRYYDLGVLEDQSATCYRSIGRAEDAIAIFERRIASSLDANLHRDCGYQMAKLANTVLATKKPEPERAAQLGLASLDLARQTGSARIAKELDTLDATLTARWPDQPDVRTFHDALTTR